MAILTGRNLSLGYDGKLVIENVNFEVNQGDYLCIVGENGAGKSTLMKTILGLIDPLHGEIIYEEGLKRNEVGYLPQQTLVQKDFPASVLEIVLSGCQGRMGLRPYYNQDEKALAKEMMDRLQIQSLSRECYRNLSGGQQQRVLLARALCATSRVLLLDEPVAGLDPKAAKDMYEIIEKLNEEGVTIIMITHEISEVMTYASHILHVSKKSFYGSKKEYISSQQGKNFLLLQSLEGIA